MVVGNDIALPVPDETGAAPTGYTLEDAFPNPFDQSTTIHFSVERSQRVAVSLYDAVGRKVRTLYEGTPSAGRLRVMLATLAGLLRLWWRWRREEGRRVAACSDRPS